MSANGYKNADVPVSAHASVKGLLVGAGPGAGPGVAAAAARMAVLIQSTMYIQHEIES